LKRNRNAEHAADVIGRISFSLSMRVLGVPKVYNEISEDDRFDIIDAQRRLNRVASALRAKECP
jgi:hypothetical protein